MKNIIKQIVTNILTLPNGRAGVGLLLMCICGAIAPQMMWADSQITYTASAKLSETTDKWTEGFHTNAFGSATVVSHTFVNGTGTVTFSGDLTSFGEHAFYGCSNLTSVTIPSGVTSIGSDAFMDCSSLTSIAIPDGVLSIGKYAFGNCTNVVSFTVPGSVTSIGEKAFSKCYVTSSNLHNSSSLNLTNYNLTIIDSEQADGLLIKNNCAVRCRPFAISVTIPSSVTSIQEYAFYYCSNLTSITIPSSVTSIGAYAFYHCSNLTSITIPSSVTSIGTGTFYYCSNLTSITIPSSVTSIGSYAFYECSNLTSITIPSSVTSIGAYAFDNSMQPHQNN